VATVEVSRDKRNPASLVPGVQNEVKRRWKWLKAMADHELL
jgi:hypothetical protein